MGTSDSAQYACYLKKSGSSTEEQEQLQLRSSLSASERCKRGLCGIAGLCAISAPPVKHLIESHVQDCSDDESVGFSEDMTLVKSTFCEAVEDSIVNKDLCPAAKLCVAAGVI